MKKSALTILALAIIISISAQVPQALNYQAVARNSMGQIVPSQSIGVRFTISDASGTTLYQETHTTTTNNFGLFTLAIGKGTAVSGTIPSIDWSAGGDKFLKVEIAPQGGINYTLQGTTQLLSVPFALFSEKTKLIGGNAITIANGNTINANYVAGIGINISGNVIAAASGYSWLLNGNAATTASNFLGTTDNMPVNFRTNNIQRLSISESNIAGSNNVSYISAGQQSNFSTNPAQINVWGKDISGTSIPLYLAENVQGMTWSGSGGANNTVGRFIRLSQWVDAAGPNYNFFDLGIDQQSDFYISDQKTWATGGGQFPRKMITITPTSFVGINFNWGEHPTANLHTKGTLRFEGLGTDNTLGRILAMDANGNVSSRDASSLSGSSYWAADPNGVHNIAGNVGLGVNSRSDALVAIAGTSTLPAAADITSSNDWQTAVNIRNNTSNGWYQLIVGGSTNNQPAYGVGVGNFGIVRVFSGGSSTIPLTITQNDFVGISNNNGGTTFLPRARLHVSNGDVYIDQIGSGVIMKSPNGQCWRMTVSDAGTPVFTAIPCP